MAGILLDSTSPDAVLAAIRNRITWRNMPIRAAAGYIDGLYKWPAAAITAIEAKGTVYRPITVRAPGERLAAIADCESEDLTSAQSAALAAAKAASGGWEVIYVNRSNKAATIADCAAHGLRPGAPAPHGFGLWIATLDGTFADLDGSDLRTQPGVVSVQYAQANSPIHAPGNPPDLDVSVVTPAGELWLGLAPVRDELVAKLLQVQAEVFNAIQIAKGL